MLCVYYKPRKCEHVRYCHLELILEIISYLCGMFAQTSSNCFIVYLMDLICKKFSWCGLSSNIFLYISHVGNRLLHVLLIIALHDYLTS
jgi:hypothetical protein